MAYPLNPAAGKLNNVDIRRTFNRVNSAPLPGVQAVVEAALMGMHTSS